MHQVCDSPKWVTFSLVVEAPMLEEKKKKALKTQHALPAQQTADKHS